MSKDRIVQSPLPEDAEKIARAKKLLSLFEKGVSETPDIIGYHGTSTETLSALLENGMIPRQTHDEPLHMSGDLFIAPISKNIPSAWFQNVIYPLEEITLDNVKQYAQSIAERHYIFRQLGLPINDSSAYDAILELTWPGDELTADFEQAPFSEATKKFVHRFGLGRLQKLFKDARKRKGVVLAIKKSALSAHGFGLGDEGEAEAKLITGESGLSIDDIDGIDSIGEDGREFFEALRRNAVK